MSLMLGERWVHRPLWFPIDHEPLVDEIRVGRLPLQSTCCRRLDPLGWCEELPGQKHDEGRHEGW